MAKPMRTYELGNPRGKQDTEDGSRSPDGIQQSQEGIPSDEPTRELDEVVAHHLLKFVVPAKLLHQTSTDPA